MILMVQKFWQSELAVKLLSIIIVWLKEMWLVSKIVLLKDNGIKVVEQWNGAIIERSFRRWLSCSRKYKFIWKYSYIPVLKDYILNCQGKLHQGSLLELFWIWCVTWETLQLRGSRSENRWSPCRILFDRSTLKSGIHNLLLYLNHKGWGCIRCMNPKI